jgi:hypothetical protein
MKRVLSLFDHTGRWSAPYYDAGYDVFEVDVQNFIAVNIMDVGSAAEALAEWGDFDIILAAPPCTDFAASGARHWKKKDAQGATAASVELVRQVQRLIDLYQPTDPEYIAAHGDLIWAIENPVGRLGNLFPELGKPWYFDPCDFALRVVSVEDYCQLDTIRAKDGRNLTRAEVELVQRSEAYTKRTGLWGNFRRPARCRIEPVRCCPQGSPLQRYGGKSQRTKNARSATPLGFARAFFEVNR